MTVLKDIQRRQSEIKAEIEKLHAEAADLIVAERVLLSLGHTDVGPIKDKSPAQVPPKSVVAPKPLPQATLIRPQQQSHDAAMVTDKRLWERFAEYLSHHGVWPGIKTLENHTGIKSVYMRLCRLEKLGYVCRAGRNGALWWCKKWPDGMVPIEPPPDMAGMICETEYVPPPAMPEPESSPAALAEKLPGSCNYGACRYPKQPGRDMCSVHLALNMPPRQRANEV